MRLALLLTDFCSIVNIPDIPVQNLSLDTRTIKKEGTFIAVPGIVSDGRAYILESYNKGAKIVIAQAPLDTAKIEAFAVSNKLRFKKINNVIFFDQQIIVEVQDLTSNLGSIVKKYYKNKINNLNIIGITGTNGKTSVASHISTVLTQNNCKTATIGTIGYGFSDSLIATGLTTPDCITTHNLLAKLEKYGAKKITIEASSHAIEQNRLAGIDFSTIVFTNLTQDHLDYHKSMPDYFRAKSKLFNSYKYKHALINIDDEYGRKLYKDLKATKSNKNILSFGINKYISDKPDISVGSYSCTINGITAKIATPWGSGELQSSLLGEFNLSNLLAVIGVSCIEGTALIDVLAVVANLTPVPGRLVHFSVQNKPMTVVDYAHTPDALHNALKALKQLVRGKLICVFGCGGDRDKQKRPLMLKAALGFSDKIIITNDNPRSEEPNQIITEILNGASNTDKERIVVEPDRKKAIEYAILTANVEDVVLIAGKGHEDYQIIGKDRFSFCDVKQVKLALKIKR